MARAIYAAGFVQVSIVEKPESREFIKDWLPGSGAEKYVVSARITASKPATAKAVPAAELFFADFQARAATFAAPSESEKEAGC